jgi:hypothetical protein
VPTHFLILIKTGIITRQTCLLGATRLAVSKI